MSIVELHLLYIILLKEMLGQIKLKYDHIIVV